MGKPTELTHLKSDLYKNDQAEKLKATFEDLHEMLTRVEHLVVPELLIQATNLFDELNSFAVRASLIGQVKAGKTALSNAMLGTNDLLPSDVNPWTSVVTSVHINQTPPKNKRAIFKFFDRDDWDTMIETGGRIADMAQKADLDTEVADLRQQIEDMQSQTIKRLGKNFELLLGGQHSFSDFDGDLIKRYVCLGDDGDLQAREGRFADMTKSAQLFIDSEKYPYPISLSDTPGVNDPFLVREAVTLDSLGSADVCVIVLSAHQALSTADLALMRILINLKHEQIVLFVNRIDELSDPQAQMEEINCHIRQTLADQDLPDSIPVVFGSAAWAEAYVAGSLDVLPNDSVEALDKLITAREGTPDDQSNLSGTADLSGMTALHAVLDHKVINDICFPFIRSVVQRATALALQSRSILSKTSDTGLREVGTSSIDIGEVEDQIEAFLTDVDERFEDLRTSFCEQMNYEMSGVFNGFIFRETRSLKSHIDGKEKMSEWTPDAEDLRKSLNGVYTSVSSELQDKVDNVYSKTHGIFEGFYEMLSGDSAASLGLKMPEHPKPATPVSLMRTMTIDFSAGWISGWLARRLKKDSFVKKFKDVTVEQMQVTLKEIREKHIEEYCDLAQAHLQEFVDMHMTTLRSHAQLDSIEERAELRRKLGSADAIDSRIAELSDHISEFEDMESWLTDDEEIARKSA
jgi:cell fate (sporulation/competence/biofilm development) regulator YlbF (YheA/YmcA/DUF963 family)